MFAHAKHTIMQYMGLGYGIGNLKSFFIFAAMTILSLLFLFLPSYFLKISSPWEKVCLSTNMLIGIQWKEKRKNALYWNFNELTSSNWKLILCILSSSFIIIFSPLPWLSWNSMSITHALLFCLPLSFLKKKTISFPSKENIRFI